MEAHIVVALLNLVDLVVVVQLGLTLLAHRELNHNNQAILEVMDLVTVVVTHNHIVHQLKVRHLQMLEAVVVPEALERLAHNLHLALVA